MMRDGTPGAPTYWVPKHVHLCATSDGVVFLDVRKDKYLGIGGRQVRWLSALLPGCPQVPSNEGGGERISMQDAISFAEHLVQKGLLTREAANGKSGTPVALEPVDMNSSAGEDEFFSYSLLRYAPGFAIACLDAALTLKYRGLETALARVEARKKHNAQDSSQVDVQRVSQLVHIFRHLQRFAYSRKDRCLFDAIALVNFLARHGQFPLLVLGVRTHTFAAHSWVQYRQRVFDSNPEDITEFTPILAI